MNTPVLPLVTNFNIDMAIAVLVHEQLPTHALTIMMGDRAFS